MTTENIYTLSFQNPSYNDNFNIEANQEKISQSHNDYIVDLVEQRRDESNSGDDETNSLEEEKRSLHGLLPARSNSTFLSDVDIVCCNRVYTVKPRTYNNIKSGIQMIKPFIVLSLMAIVLIFVFKIDILLPETLSEGIQEVEE